MSDNASGSNFFVRHPTGMKIDLAPYSNRDYYWTGIVVLGTLLLMSQFPDVESLLLLAGGGFWFLTMVPFIRGVDERPYELVFVVPVLEFILELNGGIIWDANRIKLANLIKFPFEVREFGNMGLVYHLWRKTYSMVFECEGSDMSAESLVTQFGYNMRFANLILKSSVITGLKGLEIDFGYDVRPEDSWVVTDNLALMGNLDVLVPEAIAFGKPLEEYTDKDRRMVFLRQIATEMEDSTAIVTPPRMVYVVTLKDSRAFKKILKEQRFHENQIRRTPLVQIRNTLISELETVADGVRMLTGFEAESYLRASADVVHQQKYYDKIHKRRIVALSDPESEQKYDEENDHAPQLQIRAMRNRLVVDGTNIATLKLTAFPEDLDEAPVNYIPDYTPIFNLPAWFYSIHVSGKTKKGSIQYAFKDAGVGLWSSLRNFFGAVTTGVKRERKDEEARTELERLDRNAYTTSYTISVAILNGNPDELENEVRECENALRTQFNPKRVMKRFRQFNEAFSAITHIPYK